MLLPFLLSVFVIICFRNHLFSVLLVFVAGLKRHLGLQVALRLVDHDCENDHEAPDDLLPEFGYTAHGHTVIDHADNECAAESCAVLIRPTHAAQNPETAYTKIFTESALIPERRALFSFPPTARMYQPIGIFLRRIADMIARTAKM